MSFEEVIGNLEKENRYLRDKVKNLETMISDLKKPECTQEETTGQVIEVPGDSTSGIPPQYKIDESKLGLDKKKRGRPKKEV